MRRPSRASATTWVSTATTLPCARAGPDLRDVSRPDGRVADVHGLGCRVPPCGKRHLLCWQPVGSCVQRGAPRAPSRGSCLLRTTRLNRCTPSSATPLLNDRDLGAIPYGRIGKCGLGGRSRDFVVANDERHVACRSVVVDGTKRAVARHEASDLALPLGLEVIPLVANCGLKDLVHPPVRVGDTAPRIGFVALEERGNRVDEGDSTLAECRRSLGRWHFVEPPYRLPRVRTVSRRLDTSSPLTFART